MVAATLALAPLATRVPADVPVPAPAPVPVVMRAPTPRVHTPEDYYSRQPPGPATLIVEAVLVDDHVSLGDPGLLFGEAIMRFHPLKSVDAGDLQVVVPDPDVRRLRVGRRYMLSLAPARPRLGRGADDGLLWALDIRRR